MLLVHIYANIIENGGYFVVYAAGILFVYIGNWQMLLFHGHFCAYSEAKWAKQSPNVMKRSARSTLETWRGVVPGDTCLCPSTLSPVATEWCCTTRRGRHSPWYGGTQGQVVEGLISTCIL